MALMLNACNSNHKKEVDEFMAIQQSKNYYVVTLSDVLEEVNTRSIKNDY